MAKITMKLEGKNVKSLISALAANVQDALFRGTQEGLKMKALDPSHVSLSVLDLPEDSFVDYKLEGGDVKIPINIDDVNKYLGRARNEDTVTMSYDNADARMIMQFEGGGISKKTFHVPLSRIDLDDSPDPPEMILDVNLRATPDFIVELVKDCKVVSAHVTFSTREGEFFASASESGGPEGEFAYSAEGLLGIESSIDSKASYTLRFLEDMAKVASVAESMSLSFSTDKPVIIVYDLIGGGTVQFLLAPRLEPDFS